MAKHHITHGMTGTPIYLVWTSMRNRCGRPATKNFADYGGRGIRVCEAWNARDGFIAFYRDMGPRPPGFTIEREDNDGDYEPSNCSWQPRSVQSRNKRNTREITARGRTQTLIDWARELGCSPGAILFRLNAEGWDEERAVTEPIPDRPNGKLTLEQAAAIKARRADPLRALAREFGVCQKSILNIRQGKTFAYL